MDTVLASASDDPTCVRVMQSFWSSPAAAEGGEVISLSARRAHIEES